MNRVYRKEEYTDYCIITVHKIPRRLQIWTKQKNHDASSIKNQTNEKWANLKPSFNLSSIPKSSNNKMLKMHQAEDATTDSHKYKCDETQVNG